MDFSRIKFSVDTEQVATKTIAFVGVGAAIDLICDLVRSGVLRVKLFDPDTVRPENLARQGFRAADIGLSKVDAAANTLLAINPELKIITSVDDITLMTDAEIDKAFGDVDLLILATDRFDAQAKGNQIALRLQTPALWIGLYELGLGGEILFWRPGIAACFRCLVAKRYRLHAQALESKRSIDPPSRGVTILDVRLIDAIAGQLALGLLTRGSDTRCGRLIGALRDRNFLQVKIDPDFRVGNRDVVRDQLGIPTDNDTFFAWNTIVRRDPDGGALYCPDCWKFGGRAFAIPPGSIH